MPSLSRSVKPQDKPEAKAAPKGEGLTGSLPSVRLAVALPPPSPPIKHPSGRVASVKNYDRREPIHAFHGTDATFEQFDTSEVNALERKRLGAYFTENKRFAGCYGSKIIEVNLILSNPFDITDKSAIEVITMLPINDRLKQELRSGFRSCDGGQYGLLEAAVRGGLRKNLEADGFDSIKFTEGCANAYIAFHPEQIEQVKPVHVTETPEFKGWFRNSKVVDTEGNPLVVYHGTRRSFENFEVFSPRGAIGNPDGIYFTPDKRAAEEYAMDCDGAWDEKSRVVEAFLSINSEQDGAVKESTYSGTEYIIFDPTKILVINQQ